MNLEQTEMAEGVDVIIGSDVVYDLTAARAVPCAVRSLLNTKHGVAIIVLPAMRMVRISSTQGIHQARA